MAHNSDTGLAIGDERVIRECIEDLQGIFALKFYSQKVSKLISVTSRLMTMLGQMHMRRL